MRADKNILRLTGLFSFLILLIFMTILLLHLFSHFFGYFLSESFYADFLVNNLENPFLAVFFGTLLSVLVRSSSIVITLLAAMVFAGFPFSSAIFVVMGANIGTTFQSSLSNVIPNAQVNDRRRMMTISSMHYFNNIIAFAIFFPLQISTDFLGRGSQSATQWLNSRISLDIVSDTGQTSLLIQSLMDILPVNSHLILIIILFTLLIIFLMRVFFITLRLIFDPLVVRVITRQISYEEVEEKILLDGVFISGLLQSSSSTIYILMPLVRKITCNIPLIYSLILGINVGTCFTTILFALLLQSKLALSIGLAHFFYNFIALLIFTYIPLLKELPILASKYLAFCSYGDGE